MLWRKLLLLKKIHIDHVQNHENINGKNKA